MPDCCIRYARVCSLTVFIELKSAELLRSLRNVECLPGGMARMEDGREVVNLASNDYLGLAHHPALVEAFARGARDGGAGAMASRLVTGTQIHSGWRRPWRAEGERRPP